MKCLTEWALDKKSSVTTLSNVLVEIVWNQVFEEKYEAFAHKQSAEEKLPYAAICALKFIAWYLYQSYNSFLEHKVKDLSTFL